MERIRQPEVQNRRKYASDDPEKQKVRNEKRKAKQNLQRGRIEYYYKDDADKITLQNKMDKIKLFMGEGSFNKVSSFELLHRVMDYFILCCLPEEENQPVALPQEDPSSYQYINEEQAKDENMFVCTEFSIQQLVHLIQHHSQMCSSPLKLSFSNMLHHVSQANLACAVEQPHHLKWVSSPHTKNGKFVANLRMAHGFLSSGMLPNQYQKFTQAANIGVLGEKYIGGLQKNYSKVVEAETTASVQDALLEEIASTAMTVETDEEVFDGIGIVTDARHCWRKNAKFSDVVCMGEKTHKVLKVETISRMEDPCSQRHELAGVRKIYDYFDKEDCPVKLHAHDRNNSITKFVKEQRSPTENALDTWHMTKNIAKISKKITTGRKELLGKTWHPELSDKAASIKTHVYWCMKNCKGNYTKLRKSILNLVKHYQGNHLNCFETSRCRGSDANLSPYEPSKCEITAKEAENILINFLKKLPVYKKAKEYRYCADTHYVESFNNCLLQYHDKRIVFGRDTYSLRINLSILDWNENVNRVSTSKREIEDAMNPRRKSAITVKKAKTFNFKDKIYRSWIKNIYH